MHIRTTQRPRGGPRRIRFTTLVAAPLLAAPLLAGAASPASAAPAGPGDAALATAATDQPTTVTLITGDRVTVRPGAGATVEPGPGRDHVTFVQQDGGDKIVVMPSDAGPLVTAGVLDERLFDVSYLIKQGYDDASRDSVPLLVTGQPDQVSTTVTRHLPLTAMSALEWRKPAATTLWSKLSTRGGRAGPSTATTLSGGVDRIWLDAKIEVTLDQSVPMIGAPQAWAQGYDGTGVKVAVLDSGIDTTHPDLAGKVTAAANFTFEPSAADGNGHGTHVASTIAGSGAASGGRYKGVAPGASLLNGKVCNSAGQCPTSWVLAGMEWAVANGADVVNMSLGGGPTDGSDPLSQAVNRLTASSGTLFVIAAGNSGPGASTVESPGSADAALTVAAVDKSRRIAGFSSRGPRFGDSAIKPDIAAPGVSIVAARATGTSLGSPVDDRYTSLNGTSMATPHVTGAAAIVAQRHPDWTADLLKADLMNAAAPLDGLGPFQVGAGLVDVPHAVTSPVTATPSVSFGLVRWPHEVPPATRPVTYRNDGGAPVTLDLALTVTDQNGTAAPAGMFTLDTNRITVPANGTATVQLTMAPQPRRAGDYAGLLTATAGATAVRTALGAVFERESYNLTVNLLDRNGQPPTAAHAWPVTFNVFDYATSESHSFLPPGATLRLPVGDYGVNGYVTTPRPDLPDNRSQFLDDITEVAYPGVRLDRDTVLTLDARQARKVDVAVDRPDARLRTMTINSGFKVLPENGNVAYFHMALSTKGTFTAVGRNAYVGSVGSSDMFVYLVQAVLEQPLIQLEVNGRHGFPVDVMYAENAEMPRTPLVGTDRMDAVVAGTGTAGELARIDVGGKLVVLASPPTQDATLLDRVSDLRRAGARAVLLDRSPLDRPAIAPDVAPALPILLAADPQRTRLVGLAREGGVSVTTTGVLGSPYQYNLALPTEGHMPEKPVFHPVDRELGAVTVDYRETAPPARLELKRAVFQGRSWASGLPFLRTTSTPLRRTEFYSPGPVRWQRESTYGAGGPWRRAEQAEFPAGSQSRETQFASVVGPSLSTPPLSNTFAAVPRRAAWAFRDGNVMDIQIPLLVDQAPGHVMMSGDIRSGFARLYRDGTLVAAGVRPGVVASTVPAAGGRYRLEAGVSRFDRLSGDRWELSSAVTAAWTFRSAQTPSPTALPLMTVRYEPKLDEYNQAPAGRPFEIPVRVNREAGATAAPVTELLVQASYDDGETWRPAQLIRAGTSWRAIVDNPAQGFVNLRAVATDADGNTVEQVVENAYAVAGSSARPRAEHVALN
jgi:subtilisin family serine protease